MTLRRVQPHIGQIGQHRFEVAAGSGRHRDVHAVAELVEGQHSFADRALQQAGDVFAVGISYSQVPGLHSFEDRQTPGNRHGVVWPVGTGSAANKPYILRCGHDEPGG